MANPFDYCPHCGENLKVLAEVSAPIPEATAAPAAPERAVVKREVTSREKDAIWGFLPLPFQMVPVGVLESGGAAVALVCEDPDNRLWELAAGESRLLEAPVRAPSASPAAGDVSPVAMPPAATQPTVPEHACMNSDSAAARAARGAKSYGS